jgi:basic amino acid/polyamine antiporter, APA family
MAEQHAGGEPPHLLRILGLAFGLAVVVGGMVGSGVLRAPGVVALGIPGPALILIAWALGGAVTLLSAMPLAEAGASVPLAGGPYPIAERAFGPTAGFLTGWWGWLGYTGANGFISVVFGEYVHRLGFAAGISNGALACGLILAMGALNLSGTRLSGASQNVASAAKVAALLALSALLFAVRSHGPLPAAAPAGGALAVGGIGAAVMALRVIYQTYAGWDAAIYFSEELHRPGHTVVRATLGGIAAVTVLYVLVNAAALHVLPPAAMAGSALAMGDAAKVALGGGADALITALGLFSLAAIVNLQIMATSRVPFRMARDGALPAPFALITRGGAPWVGVILALAGALAVAATGSYESIVRIYTPWSMGAGLMVTAAAIRLRIAEPDLPRPWRMPLFPWLAIVAGAIQVGLLAVVIWDDPGGGLISAAIGVAPLPLYLAFARRRGGRRSSDMQGRET